jgi:hypothetical protein
MFSDRAGSPRIADQRGYPMKYRMIVGYFKIIISTTLVHTPSTKQAGGDFSRRLNAGRGRGRLSREPS